MWKKKRQLHQQKKLSLTMMKKMKSQKATMILKVSLAQILRLQKFVLMNLKLHGLKQKLLLRNMAVTAQKQMML
ncbi:hypothetical protein D9M73_187970 [compost metagenome]